MEDIKKMEEELSYTDDSNTMPPADIVAFNELRSCADLFRMYEKKQLTIFKEMLFGLLLPKHDLLIA